jgi:hypothetical protein
LGIEAGSCPAAGWVAGGAVVDGCAKAALDAITIAQVTSIANLIDVSSLLSRRELCLGSLS